MHKGQYLTHDSYTANVNNMTIILQTNNNLQFGNDKKVVIFVTPKSETVPLFKSILLIWKHLYLTGETDTIQKHITAKTVN